MVQFQNETGDGTLTMYEVFPGMILSYNDFHMAYYDSEYQPDRSLFCIDHCQSNIYMNNAIVEYVEGIEVIKAFGREGVSYEKFSGAITDFRTFVLKWLSSTWVTMKLAFALFSSTLLGILPAGLYLCSRDSLSIGEMVLCIMLSMSMVGSLAKLEVFANSIKEMQMTEALLSAEHMKNLW